MRRDTVGFTVFGKGVSEMAGQKTGSEVGQNVAGLLCYVLGWVTGISVATSPPVMQPDGGSGGGGREDDHSASGCEATERGLSEELTSEAL